MRGIVQLHFGAQLDYTGVVSLDVGLILAIYVSPTTFACSSAVHGRSSATFGSPAGVHMCDPSAFEGSCGLHN